jgi:beta-N-acetylhexosaminidase
MGRIETALFPFVASDQEGGGVQRIRGAASLPAASSYRQKFSEADALAAIETDAEKAARELRRVGINLNLAPVAEAASSSSFLGNRSYGADPSFAGRAASAFIRGMDRGGVACTVKHFPGHSGSDPHKTSDVAIAAEGAELDALLSPFRAAFASRPAAVMASHAVVKAWDGKNASLSPAAVKVLREEMGFGGIIIADDFIMEAAAGSGGRKIPPEKLAVQAIAAGIDMVMAWPANVESIRREIVAAVADGRIARARLVEAASRIVAEKLRYGLAR